MNFFLSSFLAVGKVFLAVTLGLLVLTFFPNRNKTLKAFNHIAVKIFLPSLVLTRFANDITWEMIQKHYWACILPVVPMALGLIAALIFRRFVPSDCHGLLFLACIFQDVTTFGLGVVLNTQTSWFSKETANEGQTYVLLYHLVHSLFLWIVGTALVEKFALEEEAESAEMVISPECNSNNENNSTDVTKQREGMAPPKETQLQYKPVRSLEEYQPIGPPSVSTTQRKNLKDMTCCEYIRLQCGYVFTGDFIAGIAGLLIALFPPVHFLFGNAMGEVILGGVSLLAGGAPPLLLIVLGMDVTAGRNFTLTLPTALVVCVALLRFFIIPLIGFGIIHALMISGIMACERPFVLTMLILMCAPTAVNTSVLCSMYSFKVMENTKLLFFTYVTCIFTTMAWLSFYIWYLEKV